MFSRKNIMPIAIVPTIVPTIGMVLSVFTNIAHAESNSWYVGASIGSVDVSDVNTLSAPVADVPRRIDIATDSDTAASIFVGKTLFTSNAGNQLNVDFSYSESDHDIERIAFMGRDFLASEAAAEGSIELSSVMLRASYKFNLGLVKPYIGIGIGSVDFEVDGRYSASVGVPAQAMPPFATDGDSATSLQARLGLEYRINDNFGLFVEYAKTDVDEIEFTRRGGGPGGLNSTTQSGDLDLDTISFGASYSF